MAILSNTACLLAVSLAPQQPPPEAGPASTGPAIPFATALPADTTLVLSVGPLPDPDALRESRAGRWLSGLPWPPEVTSSLDRLAERLAASTGLETDVVLDSLLSGTTVALCGLDGQRRPRLAILVRLGTGEPDHSQAFARAAARLEKEGLLHRRGGSGRVWNVLGTGGAPVSLALQDGCLVASTSEGLLDDVVQRLQNGGDSLADDPDFRRFARHDVAGRNRIASAFVRPSPLLAQLLPAVPGPAAETARRLLDTLALEQVRYVGYSARLLDGEIADHLRLSFPEPRRGLLGALAGPKGGLQAGMARLVPPGVSAFSAGRLAFKALFEQAIALATAVEPNAKAMVDLTLRRFEKQTGVDLQQDLLASLGHDLLTLQWPAGEGGGSAGVLELRDADRFRHVLSSLLSSSHIEPEPRPYGQHEIQVVDRGIELAFAIEDGHLIVAGSEKHLRQILDQMAKAPEQADAVRLFANLPEGAQWLSWADLGMLARTFESALDSSAAVELPPGARRLLAAATQGIEGSMTTSVTRDERGLSLRSQAPFGNLYLAVAAGVAGSVALPNLLGPHTAAAASGGPAVVLRHEPERTPEQKLALCIAYIRRAESTAQESQGHYVDLQTLTGAGELGGQELMPAGEGLFQHHGYLLKVLLPETGADRHYAVMAWPKDSGTGRVLAATEQYALLANDVIASSMGIRVVTPTDLFHGGVFGDQLSTGWRETPAARLPTPADADRELIETILTAEKKKGGSSEVPAELFDALASERPDIVARAAYALGKLGVGSAVEPLCGIVANHDDVEVRRQAMAALGKLHSPGSITASVRALSTNDPMLRALAAQNLGSLKARQATSALIAAAGRTEQDGGQQRDRIAALLALADIGDPETLLPVAAAIDGEVPELGVALTYLFQQVSPKLDPTAENTVLMAVLDHPQIPLRRYAIQRLGQLHNPDAQAALEGRLASESEASLRPLIEVSIQAVRGTPDQGTGSTDGVIDAVVQKWNGLSPSQRGLVAGGGFGALVIAFGLLFWRRRRARAANAEQWAAMTAPSDDFVDEMADAYTQYDEGDEDGQPHDLLEGGDPFENEADPHGDVEAPAGDEYAEDEYGDGEYDESYDGEYDDDYAESAVSADDECEEPYEDDYDDRSRH